MSKSERTSTEQLEEFVNDCLKEELKQLEEWMDKYNRDVIEYMELRNTINTLREHTSGNSFKTQVNVGSNIFMEAKVENLEKILVDIGKNYYLELSLEEAVKYADLRIKVLEKQCQLLREQSIKKRAEIKLALMCIGENEKLHDEPISD